MTALRRHAAPEAPSDPQEAERLIALVHECVSAAVARRALLLRLSHLPPGLARPHHRRLARAALAPLLSADRAQAFGLPNGDVVVVWRGAAEPALRRSLHAVAELFAGGGGAPEPVALCRLFDLPDAAAALLQAAEASLVAVPDGAAAPEVLAPLDAGALAALEAALARADVARFARRRPICALGRDGFRLRWEKRFLSITELAAVLAPGRSAQAEPWLFRRLTRTLDRRMLALLAAPAELRDARPFSLNLNVASILAPEFLRFDATLPAGLRGRVTLDLLAADILADLSTYVFARDFARSRGYRLLLRGVTAESLAALPPERLGLDWLQLRWSPALLAIDAEPSADPERLVLGHADSPQAIAWGRMQGIALFHGTAVAPARAGRR